jgi:ATP-dependent DNA helicase MPH1
LFIVYRWFPEGKAVFVAPTKPLVAQQIDACHKTCGIPGRDAVELTGNNPRAFRYKAVSPDALFLHTEVTLAPPVAGEAHILYDAANL